MSAKLAVFAALAAASMPLAAATGASAARSVAVTADRPLVVLHTAPSSLVVSSNWSGYAAAQGPFKSVSAGWVQPAVQCGTRTTYASFWVGLDGLGSNTTEQTGTVAQCSGGHATYAGWVQFYPSPPKYFSATVKPGDVMTASVGEAGGVFTTNLHNATRTWTGVAHRTTSALRRSAEVIAEAPSDQSGVLPLANFGTVKFTNARINGRVIARQNLTQIVMETSGGIVKAQPSPIDFGTKFTVTWHHS
jgi:hypothetical protein